MQIVRVHAQQAAERIAGAVAELAHHVLADERNPLPEVRDAGDVARMHALRVPQLAIERRSLVGVGDEFEHLLRLQGVETLPRHGFRLGLEIALVRHRRLFLQ